MSTYTYKLKGARWLRMWTAADRSSVYAAQSEALRKLTARPCSR